MTERLKKNKLTPPKFVRLRVFKMTQAVYAEALGLAQGTVSKWESAGKFTSVDGQERVLDYCDRHGIPFKEQWLFRIPYGRR